MTETVYMQQPPGFVDTQHPNYLCRLKKAIYGLRQAPRAWHDALKQYVLSYGFKMSQIDPSLFIYSCKSVQAFFLVYVDDILVTGNSGPFVSKFIHDLSNRFSIKNLGTPHYFLGIEIIPTTKGLFLSQHRYIRDLIEKHNMTGAKPSSTPLCTSTSLHLHDGTATVDSSLFRSIIGALQYVTLTRPDVSFAINKLSQFMHKPTQTHMQQLKRVLRYLKGTINLGLQLNKPPNLSLIAFSDSDWAGNVDDRTSTSSYIIFLGGNPISWSSKRQRSVARSSTEAEYKSVAHTAAELTWLTHLLSEIGIPSTSPPSIYCHNIRTTYLCANPLFHSRMKHLALDYHFVQELVQQGRLVVSHISTRDQVADILTKPLSSAKFQNFRSKMHVTDGTMLLRGRNR